LVTSISIAKSSLEFGSYNLRIDQLHQQLDTDYHIKMNSRLTNSNQDVQL